MKSANIPELAKKVLSADPTALAQAITLVESQNHEHWQQAKQLLTLLKDHGKSSFRLGLSGPPGVGKSTFVEALGKEILKRKYVTLEQIYNNNSQSLFIFAYFEETLKLRTIRIIRTIIIIIFF